MFLLEGSGGYLLNPDTGLFAWTTGIFLVFWFLVIRASRGPLKSMLGKRNLEIQEALDEAEKARIDMANLKADNEKMIAAAKAEHV
jgi:F-type H+-transporting ATPase subunit b